MTAFWNIVEGDRRFRGAYLLIALDINQTMQCNIPKDSHLHCTRIGSGGGGIPEPV
jgi:hypothetical protein